MGRTCVWLVMATLAVGVFESPAEAWVGRGRVWRSCAYHRPSYHTRFYVFEDFGECEELYDPEPDPIQATTTVADPDPGALAKSAGGETCDASAGGCIPLNSGGDGPPGPSGPVSQAENDAVVAAIDAMSPVTSTPTSQENQDAVEASINDAIDAMSPTTTPPSNEDNVAAVVAAVNEDAVAVALDGPAPTAATPSTPDSTTADSTTGTTGNTGNSGNAPGDGDAPGPAGTDGPSGPGDGSADGTAY